MICLPEFIRDTYDALIVSNGHPVHRRLFGALRERSCHLVALDGGLETLRRWNITPEHVVGDLDSVSAMTLKWARQAGAKVHRRPSPDVPDVSKGLELCRSLGFRNLAIVGFAGDRPDHMLATFEIALKSSGSIELFTDEVVFFPLCGRVNRAVRVPVNHLLSWYGYPAAEGCAMTGVRWPFRNRTLRLGEFYSLSNEPVEEFVRVSQRRGRSLLSVSLEPSTFREST